MYDDTGLIPAAARHRSWPGHDLDPRSLDDKTLPATGTNLDLTSLAKAHPGASTRSAPHVTTSSSARRIRLGRSAAPTSAPSAGREPPPSALARTAYGRLRQTVGRRGARRAWQQVLVPPAMISRPGRGLNHRELLVGKETDDVPASDFDPATASRSPGKSRHPRRPPARTPRNLTVPAPVDWRPPGQPQWCCLFLARPCREWSYLGRRSRRWIRRGSGYDGRRQVAICSTILPRGVAGRFRTCAANARRPRANVTSSLLLLRGRVRPA